MKPKINLLPTNLKGRSDIVRLSNYLKTVAAVTTAILIVLGLIAGGYMFFLNNQIRTAQSASKLLESELGAMEIVEQQFVLVKDRVGKVKPLLAAKDAGKNVELFKSLHSSFPAGIEINEAQIGEEIIEFTFSTTDSRNLIGVFSSLSASQALSGVFIENFSFNATVGYVASLKLQLKT